MKNLPIVAFFLLVLAMIPVTYFITRRGYHDDDKHYREDNGKRQEEHYVERVYAPAPGYTPAPVPGFWPGYYAPGYYGYYGPGYWPWRRRVHPAEVIVPSLAGLAVGIAAASQDSD